jgi:hypothetical protein
MHHYPLFASILVDCECCKIPCQFEFTSKSDQVICKGCRNHLGDGPEQRARRDREHAGLYRSELLISLEDRESERHAHAAQLQELKGERDRTVGQRDVEISDLQAAIRAGELNPAVEHWLANEKVRDALDKRDGAYRSRDFAFAALWAVATLHHPDEHHDGMCSCGRRESNCRELEAIWPEHRALSDWEDTQIERLKDGLDHGLPREHPEVLRLGGGYLRRRRTG